MIGHSAGELACAYADGCVTAEQMILASYYRGLALLEAKFIPRTMATVGKYAKKGHFLRSYVNMWSVL